MARGHLCISIDLELAWGVWDCLTREDLDLCSRLERPIVGRLLELFSTYEVPVTWAFVGALMDAQAAKERAGPEACWFAEDLIDDIRATKLQEVGSHSFSHQYFPSLTPDEARVEIERVREVHDRHGLACDVFVFPRNLVAHLDVLAHAGIKLFRGMDRTLPNRLRDFNKTAGRAAHLLETAMPHTPPTVSVEREHPQILELRGSMGLLRREGLRRLATPRMVEANMRRGLAAASTRDQVFHLWFHPFDLYREPDVQFLLLEKLLRRACEMREEGTLGITPMGGFLVDESRTDTPNAAERVG